MSVMGLLDMMEGTTKFVSDCEFPVVVTTSVLKEGGSVINGVLTDTVLV
jgi:hypothetical protein